MAVTTEQISIIHYVDSDYDKPPCPCVRISNPYSGHVGDGTMRLGAQEWGRLVQALATDGSEVWRSFVPIRSTGRSIGPEKATANDAANVAAIDSAVESAEQAIITEERRRDRCRTMRVELWEIDDSLTGEERYAVRLRGNSTIDGAIRLHDGQMPAADPIWRGNALPDLTIMAPVRRILSRSATVDVSA